MSVTPDVDGIAEATTDPWPRKGPGRQPPPRAVIRNGHLHLWYGDPDDVVLSCAPIPLAELGV